MKPSLAIYTLAATFALSPLTQAADSHGKAGWFYAGEGTAHHWGDIDESYEACKAGQSQSPINISSSVTVEDLVDFDAHYTSAPLMVQNNGHTLHVDLDGAGYVKIEGKRYDLAQMHFHTPSEHYIDGAPYPMEAHLVHADGEGKLAVIGVMFKLGANENPAIEKLWSHIPAEKSTETVAGLPFSAAEILPENFADYRYSGSLTTPPCSEIVSWHVLKTPISISRQQLIRFQTLFPVNARPIQPLNGRVVQSR